MVASRAASNAWAGPLKTSRFFLSLAHPILACTRARRRTRRFPAGTWPVLCAENNNGEACRASALLVSQSYQSSLRAWGLGFGTSWPRPGPFRMVLVLLKGRFPAPRAELSLFSPPSLSFPLHHLDRPSTRPSLRSIAHIRSCAYTLRHPVSAHLFVYTQQKKLHFSHNAFLRRSLRPLRRHGCCRDYCLCPGHCCLSEPCSGLSPGLL